MTKHNNYRYYIDCIYVAASSRDARFTRICVASIRSYYPKIPIRLLIGSELERGLLEELSLYWDVEPSSVTKGDWGWGFVKLEPLFGRTREKFLIVDSDTVMTGPILELLPLIDAYFVVDDEQQNDENAKRLYYDWREVFKIDSKAMPPQFLFNSGQWFGTAGVLERDDFIAFVDWSTMPPRHRHSGLFMPGDQGVLNYVLNQKASTGQVTVALCKIMVWPGRGLDGITAEAISNGTAPARIIHWAGIKANRLGSMTGGDILYYFERLYYKRIPGGRWKRIWRRMAYPTKAFFEAIALRLRILTRRMGWLVSGFSF